MGGVWDSIAVVGLAVIGLIGVVGLEAQARPRGVGLARRSSADHLMLIGAWLLMDGVLVLILARSGLALVSGSAVLAGLLIVNNTKEALLREPLLFDDYDYLVDALRHPRLFWPYIGTTRVIGSGLAVAAVLTFGGWMEPSWAPRSTALSVALVGFALLFGGYARDRRWQPPGVSEAPRQAVRRRGLFASLLVNLLRALIRCRATPTMPDHTAQLPRRTPMSATPDRQRHRIAVQSESFLDPRRRMPGVNPGMLPHFDRLRQSGHSGSLSVPAFGANTVRTEHAFLSGYPSRMLGDWRFNPYRHIRHGQLNGSWVKGLRAQGYHTICVHPYVASFYARDRVMPLLGFDEFVDINAFEPGDGQALAGISPYVSDAAVADWVIQRLNENEAPLFIFVITMESHGPYPPEAESATYLKHLANADDMLGRLADALCGNPRGGQLCWYGDHPPILPQAWSRHGYPGRWTDYLLWSSAGQQSIAPPPLHSVTPDTLGRWFAGQ